MIREQQHLMRENITMDELRERRIEKAAKCALQRKRKRDEVREACVNEFASVTKDATEDAARTSNSVINNAGEDGARTSNSVTNKARDDEDSSNFPETQSPV